MLHLMHGRDNSHHPQGNYWDVELTLLSHNTILGAAGSAILNAEMAIAGQWV